MANKIEQSFYFVYSYSGIGSTRPKKLYEFKLEINSIKKHHFCNYILISCSVVGYINSKGFTFAETN